MRHILLLGGTTEATALATALAARGERAVLSYAGRTEAPRAQAIPTRTGGFGGVEGLADYLRREGVTHLVDATHPFAARISANAIGAAAQAGIPLLALTRPEWAAVLDAYDLRFASMTPYSPTFMYRALDSGRADVISAFSSDGRIAADRLTVLSDPKRAIPGYDAVLLVAKDRAGDARFVEALRPMLNRIPVEAMREANYRVDRDDAAKESPEAAARWLAKRVGL